MVCGNELSFPAWEVESFIARFKAGEEPTEEDFPVLVAAFRLTHSQLGWAIQALEQAKSAFRSISSGDDEAALDAINQFQTTLEEKP